MKIRDREYADIHHEGAWYDLLWFAIFGYGLFGEVIAVRTKRR